MVTNKDCHFKLPAVSSMAWEINSVGFSSTILQSEWSSRTL